MMRKFKIKNYINYIGVGGVMLVFTVISLVGSIPRSMAVNLEGIAISMVLAVSLSLVVGFLGELSLGHAGFMCVGAYLGGKTAVVLQGYLGNSIPTLLIALIVGGICAGICGLIIGLPALRLKGDYLAITTLAFGEIVRVIFLNTSENTFGGTLGLKTPRFTQKYFFIICFAVVLLVLFAVQNLIRSKHGRAITAIRDNEIAARATGINVTKYKLLAFIISAVFAGLAGVLFSYTQSNVQSDTFGYNYSIEMLVIVVLGGMGNISGSLISATAVTLLNKKLSTVLTGDLAVLRDVVYALILILVVIYNNAPALKSFRDRYNLRAIFGKKKKENTGERYDRDDAGKWDVIPTKIKMDAILSTDFNLSEDQNGGEQKEDANE